MKLPNGKVDFDPDEQARSVVHLLFEKYDELGTARSLLCWMVERGDHVADSRAQLNADDEARITALAVD